MKNNANSFTQKLIQRQNRLYYYSQRDNAALEVYLASLDAEPKLAEAVPEIDPLDDLEPFERQQYEQTLRDQEMERAGRWTSRVLRRFLPK